jgi:quercetin dioxygenase-like cupin family protein
VSEQGEATSAHQQHSDSAVVGLGEMAAALIADLPRHPAGRTAKTVVSGARMRAVVIALADGAEMAEHESPPAATLQVLTGRVTLSAGSRSWTLEAGQLVTVPPERHAVSAHADSAILLTVAVD